MSASFSSTPHTASETPPSAPVPPHPAHPAHPAHQGQTGNSNRASRDGAHSPTLRHAHGHSHDHAPVGKPHGGPEPGAISAAEAVARILASFAPLGGEEQLPALHALGRVLAEDVPAVMDVPPFDNSAMDGYAVRGEDVAAATQERPVSVRVIGEVAAGLTVTRPIAPGEAYRILTGAPLPPGADTVVPYELTDGKGFGGWSGEEGAELAAAETSVRVFRGVQPADNVRYAGEDQRRGDLVLRAGCVIRPAEVGVLATLGRTHVLVKSKPRVAVLSTGDEIVPVDHALRPGQIRDANGHSLAALVARYGGEALPIGIARDEPDALRTLLREAHALHADLLLTSGGVSMGDRDVVKLVLSQNGNVAFWGVDIRPGRPFTFGRYEGMPVMALPGNPVSSMVTFELFVRPALLRMAGHTRLEIPALAAIALEEIHNRSGRETFLRGIVEPYTSDGGEPAWTVRLTGDQGSGVLTSMCKANALVRLPKGKAHVTAGERVHVLMLDWPALW